MTKHLIGLFFAIGILGVTGVTTQAESIVNGGFESPLISSTFQNFPNGSSGITGWTVTGGSVDIVRQDFYPAFAGVQSLDLDGAAAAGAIQQTFATTPGQTYSLTFRYANNPQSFATVPASATVQVIGAGPGALLSSGVLHGTSTPTVMDYSLFSTTFVSDSLSTTLKFTSTDPANSVGGIVLDSVSVNLVVPEPGTLVLLGLGVVGLQLGRRRSRSH